MPYLVDLQRLSVSLDWGNGSSDVEG